MDHNLRINLEKGRGRQREEQDSIWPSTAKHLAKMHLGRGVSIPQSHVPWGESVIQGSLTKILDVSQKAAKGPKVTLSFKQCCPTWNSR